MRKVAEYRAMSDEQLALTLREVVMNLFHLRFQSATERMETPSEIKKARREVARIKTIQRERQRAAEGKAAADKVAAQQAPAQPAATGKGK
jgi:large subunit ribosomal protein L29